MRRLPDWAKAEAKGLRLRLPARKNANNTFTVRSETRPHLRHDVMPVYLSTGAIRIECGCEAGEAFPTALVPCWHATRVGRRLVREGVAVRGRNGYYLKHPELREIPGDPTPGERDQRRVDEGTDPFDIPAVAC